MDAETVAQMVGWCGGVSNFNPVGESCPPWLVGLSSVSYRRETTTAISTDSSVSYL